jgi:SpoVK/Ycf46/Vps4 family AAA+-type ATPase
MLPIGKSMRRHQVFFADITKIKLARRMSKNSQKKSDLSGTKFTYLTPKSSVSTFVLRSGVRQVSSPFPLAALTTYLVDLKVDLIRDVTWSKKAFDNLVLGHSAKELIEALVTTQINRERSTDIIHGKGNGLIMLLHGGPGTGKTFTAETVAELAEKPLYRVTCGDIGLQPQDVEQYLESVLHLGRIWGCVVLLDEADVFLEQRGLADLQRNALVSVFLRVLEYYEGILILTSNRVGTFDEAFKSRIQLALHYRPLTTPQRKKIWRNFLKWLKEVGEEDVVELDDIEDNLDELAKIDMNGRQIRNSLTTARQLALFKKERMNYEHLKHVIGIAAEFEAYLREVQDGFSDASIARADGLR